MVPQYLLSLKDSLETILCCGKTFATCIDGPLSSSQLTADIAARAKTPHGRIVGEAGIKPTYACRFSNTIQAQIDNDACLPGKTYVLFSEAQAGKSHAAIRIALQENLHQNYLYISGGSKLNAFSWIQTSLKTQLQDKDIAHCLVEGLGKNGAGKAKAKPTVLFIDEINISSSENCDFVSCMFQEVAKEETIICVILTNEEETADRLVALNGGKIRPFPVLSVTGWLPRVPPEWVPFQWTVDELRDLLTQKFPNFQPPDGDADGFYGDFLVHGMAPGDAVSLMRNRLNNGGIYA